MPKLMMMMVMMVGNIRALVIRIGLGGGGVLFTIISTIRRHYAF